MILRYLYDRNLAQASYLVGCQRTGEGLVIDPHRLTAEYLEAARQEGVRITAVTETHIHADFVSGARELAGATGATLYLSDEGGPDWQYAVPHVGLRDGQRFNVGNVVIEALHTPGHTPEHLTFRLTDGAAGPAPMGLFTGDFVFVGDVGRPDLLETAAGVSGSKEPAARALFRSIQALKAMPDYLQIWPGHGAGSACGKALGAVPSSTLGYEKLFNWAFQIDDEEAFVAEVLAGQPIAPRYFARMKRVNRDGAPPANLHPPQRLAGAGLAAILAQGATVLDVRPTRDYARGHVPGTLALPFGPTFTNYAAVVLPYDEPLYLIADESAVPAVMRELARVGLDAVAGFWTPGDVASSGMPVRSLAQVDPAGAAEFMDNGGRVVDVRRPAEHEEGHLTGSVNLPLQTLRDHLDEVPRDGPVLVYCRSGVRSVVAASLLAASGIEVVNLTGGILAWDKAKLPRQMAPEEVALLPS